MAFGLLENDFKEGMSLEDAKRLAVRSVKVAVRRDIASGGSGIDVVVITKAGYKKLAEDEVKKLAA